MTIFKKLDNVLKVTGDYRFAGDVRAIVEKRDGSIRYVVEDDRGILMIMSAHQLIKDPAKCRPQESLP